MGIARVAARILLRDLADVYTSPTAIVNILTKSPFSYRRQDMFHDVNRALGWARIRSATRALEGPRIGFAETVPSWEMPDGERYKTYGKVIWHDEISGMDIEKDASFYSDILWESDEDMEDEFSDLFGDDERYKGMTFVGFAVVGTEHNVDMPHLKLTKKKKKKKKGILGS